MNRRLISYSLIIVCIAVATACAPSKKTSTAISDDSQTESQSTDRDGTSFEKAIMAKSISSEYDWLRKNYPGCQVLRQSLVYDKRKPYDVLSVKLADGTKKDFYFDISSFFGKF